jgi:hypothetical protein
MTAQAPAQQILTPTPRRVILRSLFWVGAAIFILLVVVIAIGTVGSSVGGVRLSSTNPAPAGAMAVAEVLGQHGVQLTATSTLKETQSAIAAARSTTLFVYDPDSLLNDEQLGVVAGLADHVVIADPTFGQLQAIAPAVAQAGVVDGTLTADCELQAVRKAGSVSGSGSGFRLIDKTAAASLCLGSSDNRYSLIQLTSPTGRITLLGATDALTNEHVIERGNAALALNLLGEHENLIWYLPTFGDLPTKPTKTFAELTPPWVTPVLVLLIITFIAAAMWRGRRLGPLVIENLPVIVRASETMLGRARLYEKSSSRLRVADSLRVGAIQRLAVQCGLPRVASVDEVIAVVARIAGAEPGNIRQLLVDTIPHTDRDLMALSDALLALEKDVRRATRR